MIKGLLRKDPLNLVSNRNVLNTPLEFYNCGGFAFNLFNWFCPYPESLEHDIFFDSWGDYEESEEDIVNHNLEVTVNFMLSFFAERIRIINSISELAEGEYAVAYKTGLDDFHFLRRCPNGTWLEKMGANEICVVSSRMVFKKTWCYGEYTSRTVLFAFKSNIKKGVFEDE